MSSPSPFAASSPHTYSRPHSQSFSGSVSSVTLNSNTPTKSSFKHVGSLNAAMTNAQNVTAAADDSNGNSGAMLAQMVQKVSSFRRQLVAEKLTNQEQASTIESQQEHIKELELRLQAKEKLLSDALLAKSAAEHRLQSASVHSVTPALPVPASASMSAEFEKILQLIDPKLKVSIVNEIKRLRDEAASLQQRLVAADQHAVDDKFQFEVQRTALASEHEQLKREIDRNMKEANKLNCRITQQDSQIQDLQSQLEGAQVRCDEIASGKQEVEALANRLQQNLTSNSLEFARLQQEHDELQGMTAKLAARVFELKQKLELSELPIRRFAVQKVSPSLLLSPAMITVIKNPDSHALLLTVSDGVDDRTAHISSIQEVSKNAQKRFCIVFSHKSRMTFESNECEEIVKDLKEFIKLANMQ